LQRLQDTGKMNSVRHGTSLNFTFKKKEHQKNKMNGLKQTYRETSTNVEPVKEMGMMLLIFHTIL